MVLYSVADHWLDRPRFDWLILAIVEVLVLFVRPDQFVVIHERVGFYQSVVGASLTVVSLGAVVVTIFVTATPTDRYQKVIKDIGRPLIKTMLSCIVGMLIATGMFLSLFAFDGVSSAHVVFRISLFIAASVLLLLRALRLYWLFRQVLMLLS